jgi:hypothetical protein
MNTDILGSESRKARDRILKSKLHYDWLSDGQSVIVSSPIWGPRADFCYCQIVVVLLMWGALPEERTGLSLTTVKIGSASIFTLLYVSILHSHLLRVQLLIDTCCLQLSVSLSYICMYSKHRACQSKVGIADHTLTHVAYNGCLLTWKVICLTTAKFEPLIF